MSTQTGLDDSLVEGADLSAAQLNRVARLVSTQPYGALSAIGAGIIETGEGTALLVTFVGGEVRVAPGSAIIYTDPASGLPSRPVYGVLSSEFVSADMVDGDTTYVHAGLQIKQGGSGHENDDDTEEGTGELEITLDATEEVAGAILIGEVSSEGTLTVHRPLISISDLARRVTQVETDLGYDDTARGVGTVADRLETLETAPGGGGGGGGSVTLLSQLNYNADDPRSAITVLNEQMAALEARLTAALGSGGRVPAQSRTGFRAHREAVILQKLRQLDTLAVEDVEGAYCQLGIGGDGSADTENHLTAGNMTADISGRKWTP